MGDKEQVKRSKKEVKTLPLLDIVLASISAGKTLPQISKELNISKQNLQYYVDKLKKQNKIHKLGYGVWQKNFYLVDNSVRGHGFLWTIKLPKKILIWKDIIIKKNISFKEINNGKNFEIIFKDNRVRLSSKSILIYDIKSYFGFNAIESKKYAFDSLKSFLNELQAKLGIILSHKGNYMVKTSRQHYALVKNSLAIQCNKENKKINVYNERGLWFTIDNSFNLEEAETLHPETALIDNLGVQRYFNEHKELKWEMTPKKTLDMINQVTQNQLMFNQNFESHVEAIKTLSQTVKELREEIKNLKKIK